MSPIVAEVYGPDEAGRVRVAKMAREALSATAGIVGIDDSIDEPAPRIRLRIDPSKAALVGILRRDVVETMRVGLSGVDVTPLTLIGVLPGHAMLGTNFTATSMIGMIALAGIIVRNSILLVDFVNRKVAQGMLLQDAVIASARCARQADFAHRCCSHAGRGVHTRRSHLQRAGDSAHLRHLRLHAVDVASDRDALFRGLSSQRLTLLVSKQRQALADYSAAPATQSARETP